ncbi:MAG: LON peptidase substrate-binding domain-containing protein, partial [Sandaracinaceae bacterium]|nr:LON peptidase substrate-binding domain-containing protein [Sandaracinaceae bacterium]
MTADPGPISDEELTALPVFPLPRAVLFPGAVLPLHLFEPRYRAMMEDCVEKGPLAMAVAMLAPGWEADYEGRPAIHPIAGVGRIAQHRRRPDGRWDLFLVGQLRVRLTELPADGLEYRRASAVALEDRVPHPDAVEALRPRVLATAASVAALVRESHPDFELGLEPAMPASVLADRLADRLVAEPARRQQILEAADVKVRLALVEDAMVDLLMQIRGGRGDGFQ